MKRCYLLLLLFSFSFLGTVSAAELSLTDSTKQIISYEEHSQDEECSEITESLTDLFLTLTPGISWGKSVCEAISGKRLITGKKLTEFERKLAIIQAVAAGHGLGIGTVCSTIELLQSCEHLSPIKIISNNNI